MKARADEWLICVSFCAFLGIMAVLFWVMPKETYSEIEKKVLAEAPDLSVENLLSGDLDDELELYMSEHLPGRTFLVGVNAYFEQFTGRQITNDIYAVQGGRLVEKPVIMAESDIARKMNAIRSFAETIGQKVDLMLIPSAGWAAQSQIQGIADPYLDDVFIDRIYALASEQVTPVKVTGLYEGRPELYYRTDHHWTTQGAYLSYEAYMQRKDRPYRNSADFTVETVEGFYGSTYSRSALWLTKPDSMELWTGTKQLQVATTKPGSQSEELHDGPFYRDRLEEEDKYTVYLDGNNAVVRIENPNASGKLLVIRDSYSNCLGPLLAESYGTVVLVDLRYYNVMSPISDLCAAEDFDDVLICYSLHNFTTDANIPILR